MTRRKVAAREPTYLIEDERTVVQLLEFVLKAHRFENLFTARNILRNFFSTSLALKYRTFFSLREQVWK